jgi:hypothetical protein
LERYCELRSERQSAAAIEDIVSSTQISSTGGTKVLNRFQYMDIPLKSRPDFLSFDFDEVVLETLLSSKFPSLALSDVLSDLAEKLTQLRSIIYSITWVDGVSNNARWSESRIQCMMMLFVNHILKACAGHMEATAANRDKITLNLNSHDGTTVLWKGYADLKCCNSQLTGIDEAYATFEMKVPFSKDGLYGSAALQPKQQLLGQAMGLRQSPSASRIYNLLYLTDIFALAVMYHIEGKAYLSKRVTDAKAFCLRLLLMCHNFSPDEWDTLILAGASAVDIAVAPAVDIHMVDSNVSPINSNRSNTREHRRTGPVTRSKKNSDGNENAHRVIYGTFGCEEEEAQERRQADIAHVLRWEAKCLGYKYLGDHEMKQHNSIVS